MRTTQGLVAFAAIILLAACATPEAPTGKALLYGISIYDLSAGEGADDTDNLTYTDDDAISMATMLSVRGWTVKTGIANTQVLAESQDAMRAAIEADIAALAGTEGTVLFYYSGHGTYDYYGNTYIIPFGAIENSSDMISSDELSGMFEDAGLDDVIVILDSCNSGGFVQEGATADAIPDVYGVRDRDGDIQYTWFVDSTGDAISGFLSYSADSRYVVMSAAGAGEFSWETGGHGVFTAAILAAAESAGADLDSDGYVSTAELYAYCAAYIDANWNEGNENYYYYGSYADYLPHLSGTAREYALWEAAE